MKPVILSTARIIGRICLTSALISCGLSGNIASPNKSDQGEAASKGQGSASFALADLQSLGDVKSVQLVVAGTDNNGGPFTRTISDTYAAGKQLKVDSLPSGVYRVSLKVSDSGGKVLATAEASNVAIKSGTETKLNLTLTKAGDPGSLVVNVLPPADPAPKVVLQGYDIRGDFKTCPVVENKPCAALFVPVEPSNSDKMWQQRCEKEGHKLLSCKVDACDFSIPYYGTQVCSGKIAPPDT